MQPLIFFPYQNHVGQSGGIFCFCSESDIKYFSHLFINEDQFLFAQFPLPLCHWLGRRVDGKMMAHHFCVYYWHVGESPSEHVDIINELLD